MIPIDQAELRLATLLAEHGFDADRPDVALAIRALRVFAAEPVDAAGDALLFQTGVFPNIGEPDFQLDFTRQFEIETDGEYDGMQQLHLTFYFAATPELAALQTTLWSCDCDSIDDFFARVETLPEYRTPLGGYRPLRFEMFQEEV